MQFRFEHYIDLPVSVVFGFHQDPRNLGVLQEGWPGFRLLHHTENIAPGTTIWFAQTVAGCVPVVLGFRHTVYEPPHRFAEALIHGPFSLFTHAHEFEPVGRGTVLRDLLEVRLPWYYGGEPGVRLWVAPALRRVFVFRHRVLQRLAARGILTANIQPEQRIEI
jgi:ligand-binding SRPBCC domain-containing protein